MNLQIARSWDFNQMLVASVFAHLLLMTFVIFIPRSTYEEIVIVPAFVVELIDINKNKKKSVNRGKPRRTPISGTGNKSDSIPEKPGVPPRIIERPLPARSRPVVQKASSDILKSLNELEAKSQGALVRELDRIAKLAPAVFPRKSVVKKSAPILEQTFNELNALKNKKVEYAPAPEDILPMEDPLDQFDSLRIREDLEVESPSPEFSEGANIESGLKELKFASLSPNTVELQNKRDKKSPAELLRELTKMESRDSEIKGSPDFQKKESVDPAVSQKESREFESILKKLEALENIKPKDLNTENAVAKSLTREFQSDIRKVSVPRQVQVEVVASSSADGFPATLTGKPGADVLAKYVGLIHEKVYKNWREPLAEKHNKKVVFSFFIYPGGNIDQPELKTSSGVELLDNLARRAILESRPFPPFPGEIKSSNLNISIHFKYIPEQNK